MVDFTLVKKNNYIAFIYSWLYVALLNFLFWLVIEYIMYVLILWVNKDGKKIEIQ